MEWSFGLFLPPLLLALAFSIALMPIAGVVGWVDNPSLRKRHGRAIPLVGGVAIFLAILAASAVAGLWPDYGVLLASAAVLLLFGLFDDVKPLSAKLRFLGQGAVAGAVVLTGDVVLDDVGDLVSTGVLTLGLLAVPVTIFCIVGVINAFNMADGMDGLAGGLALVSLLSMAYLAGGTPDAQFLLVIAAAVAGFLALNARSPLLRRAMVFMGDAGSLMLGGMLAWFLIDLSQGPERAFSPSVALWLFALPLMDTVSLMIRRVRKGRSPFSPGREHLHHILQRAGLTVGQSTGLLVSLAAVLAIIGIGGHQLGIPESAMFVGFLGLFGLYLWATTQAWRLVRHMRRARISEQLARRPASIRAGAYRAEEAASRYDEAA